MLDEIAEPPGPADDEGEREQQTDSPDADELREFVAWSEVADCGGEGIGNKDAACYTNIAEQTANGAFVGGLSQQRLVSIQLFVVVVVLRLFVQHLYEAVLASLVRCLLAYMSSSLSTSDRRWFCAFLCVSALSVYLLLQLAVFAALLSNGISETVAVQRQHEEDVSWGRMLWFSKYACGGNSSAIVNVHCPTLRERFNRSGSDYNEMVAAARVSYESLAASQLYALSPVKVSKDTWVAVQNGWNAFSVSGLIPITIFVVAVMLSACIGLPSLLLFFKLKQVSNERKERESRCSSSVANLLNESTFTSSTNYVYQEMRTTTTSSGASAAASSSSSAQLASAGPGNPPVLPAALSRHPAHTNAAATPPYYAAGVLQGPGGVPPPQSHGPYKQQQQPQQQQPQQYHHLKQPSHSGMAQGNAGFPVGSDSYHFGVDQNDLYSGAMPSASGLMRNRHNAAGRGKQDAFGATNQYNTRNAV